MRACVVVERQEKLYCRIENDGDDDDVPSFWYVCRAKITKNYEERTTKMKCAAPVRT